MPDHNTLNGTALHEDKRTKEPVRAASISNITIAAPGSSIDGVSMVAGDRVLLKNQATASLNGIYVWSTAASPHDSMRRMPTRRLSGSTVSRYSFARVRRMLVRTGRTRLRAQSRLAQRL
jgi:hypothetical protein